MSDDSLRKGIIEEISDAFDNVKKRAIEGITDKKIDPPRTQWEVSNLVINVTRYGLSFRDHLEWETRMQNQIKYSDPVEKIKLRRETRGYQFSQFEEDDVMREIGDAKIK